MMIKIFNTYLTVYAVLHEFGTIAIASNTKKTSIFIILLSRYCGQISDSWVHELSHDIRYINQDDQYKVYCCKYSYFILRKRVISFPSSFYLNKHNQKKQSINYKQAPQAQIPAFIKQKQWHTIAGVAGKRCEVSKRSEKLFICLFVRFDYLGILFLVDWLVKISSSCVF